MNVEFLGYHACKPDNGREFILKEAPFLSEDNPRQWLGQGYYLWTDSDYFAHQWGEFGYKGHYVIVQCRIVYERDAIFDLVGNVEHQLLFKKFFDAYERRIKQESLDRPKTVAGLLNFLRNSGDGFKFGAVKIKDQPNESHQYTINHMGKNSVVFLPERQQICFYANKIEPNKVFLDKKIHFDSKCSLTASNEDSYHG